MFLFILGKTICFGQSDYKIEFETIIQSDDTLGSAMKKRVYKSTATRYYTKGAFAIEMEIPFSSKSRIIYNEKTKEELILTESGVRKTYIKDKDSFFDEKPSCVATITDETETIAGYSCRKYSVVCNDTITKVEFITTELKAKDPSTPTSVVGGFVLKTTVTFSMKRATWTTTSTAIKVSRGDFKEKFSMEIPEGYIEDVKEPIEDIDDK